MSVKEEIDMAIGAHGQWKHKLRSIIDSGESEVTADHVAKDNNCAFGKWLHERIDANAKSSPFYQRAVDLHAEFHKEASKILQMGLDGKKDEANAAMGITEPFARISSQLVQELTEWKASL